MWGISQFDCSPCFFFLSSLLFTDMFCNVLHVLSSINSSSVPVPISKNNSVLSEKGRDCTDSLEIGLLPCLFRSVQHILLGYPCEIILLYTAGMSLNHHGCTPGVNDISGAFFGPVWDQLPGAISQLSSSNYDKRIAEYMNIQWSNILNIKI